MGRPSDSPTSATLLGRLRSAPTDEKAWQEFVDRYGPRIHAWCRSRTKHTADVEDVSQDVMLRLVKYLRAFEYDPRESFRGWLRTVTRHAWIDHCRSRARAVAGSGDSAIHERLESEAAREELVQKLEAVYDLEVLEEASGRVRLRVQPETWEAFQLTHFEGLSAAVVAGRLNMKVASVYVARNRIQKMLREEIERLEQPGPDREPLR
jgi:RNA polymerase sigma-70 factor (ECF subfamily)